MGHLSAFYSKDKNILAMTNIARAVFFVFHRKSSSPHGTLLMLINFIVNVVV